MKQYKFHERNVNNIVCATFLWAVKEKSVANLIRIEKERLSNRAAWVGSKTKVNNCISDVDSLT